jgi:hypothetical protein
MNHLKNKKTDENSNKSRLGQAAHAGAQSKHTAGQWLIAQIDIATGANRGDEQGVQPGATKSAHGWFFNRHSERAVQLA